MEQEIRFSGEKAAFSTGATREVKKGKGKFHLVPPEYLIRLAKHYEKGGELHGNRNWEKGFELSSFVNSAYRHMIALQMGDESEDHVSALYFNAIGLDYTRKQIAAGKLPKSLDDISDIPEDHSVPNFNETGT